MTSLSADVGEITKLVSAGLLAPSGDNCQPWRFLWNGESLQIHFVPERAESLYDVQHTASWIALGALLTNLRIAANTLGCQLHIDVFPDHETSPLVAQVRWQRQPTCDDPLFPALTARCVNRRPYRRAPLPSQVKAELLSLASTAPGVSLDLLEDEPKKSALASLAAVNERILFENRALHDGLYRWLRWTTHETTRTGDGMPVESLELSGLERPGFRILASWPITRGLTALGLTSMLPWRTQRVYQRSAAIGLLTVNGTRPEDFVRGGELLERLWLTATLRDVAFQPITGITFLWLRCRLAQGDGLSARHQKLLDNVWRRLAELLPSSIQRTPIMLFRLGLASAPSGRALRRPVASVLTTVTP